LAKRRATKQRVHRAPRAGRTDLTRAYEDGREDELAPQKDRVRRSGEQAPEKKTEAKFERRIDLATDADLKDGLVKQVTSRGCAVLHDGEETWCATRGTFKQHHQRQSSLVAVGDRVKFRITGEDEGVVELVDERKTKLSRRRSRKGDVEHVMVANVDQLVIISSVKQPSLKLGLIDRYIVAAENGGLDAVICVNKIDLLGPEEQRPDADELYEAIGYTVLFTSAETGEGIEALGDVLKDKLSVISGHSGVGKSSLLNTVQPGLNLEVREVMDDKLGRGKHTTVRSTLIPLNMGGYVIDTPGIRSFGVWDIAAEELAGFFREFLAPAADCKFPGCSHTHEEGCAVKDAVETGHVDPRRYESYLSIRDSL